MNRKILSFLLIALLAPLSLPVIAADHSSPAATNNNGMAKQSANKGDFAQLLGEPKLSMNYIRIVGDRRRRMEKKLSDITSKDVSGRVCELLHELSASTFEIDAAAREYLVPLTHYDVASLIGASRQTTTSVLNQLERRGIIELGRGWIRVKCPKDLQTYSGLILVAAVQFFSHLCQLADIPLM